MMSFNIFLLWILNFNLINGEHHNVPFIDVSYETFRREFKRNVNEELLKSDQPRGGLTHMALMP